MNITKLHKVYKDKNSPSVRSQIKWLMRRGFSNETIQKALLFTYGELDVGRVPVCWVRKEFADKKRPRLVYTDAGASSPSMQWYDRRKIKSGADLNRFVLTVCNNYANNSTRLMIGQIEKFHKEMENQWKRRIPWWKRTFGIRKEED